MAHSNVPDALWQNAGCQKMKEKARKTRFRHSIRSMMRICSIMQKNMEIVNLMTPFHIRLNKS